MTSLLTNNAAMTALTTLKGINQQLDVTSNRVSTGQRVSSAADNAAYWSIATSVRTDNASLGAVKDSLGLGSSAVDTAYNGLNSILSDLQNLRSKLQTALTGGVDRSKVQTEITAIQNKMKATADSSVSSNQNWLSVNSASSNTSYQNQQSVIAGFSRAADGSITFSKVTVNVGQIKLFDANATPVNTAGTEAKVIGSTALTGTSAFAGGTVDFLAADGSGNTKQVNMTVVLGDGSAGAIQLDKTTLASSVKDLSKVTSEELISAINNQIAATGASKLNGKVTAGLDDAGRLTFQTQAQGQNTQVTVFNNTAAANFALADIGFGVTSGAAATSASSTATAFTSVDLSGNPTVTANANYVPASADLSGANTFTLTIDDGTGGGAQTITMNNAKYTGTAGVTTAAGTPSGADLQAAINKELTAQNIKAQVEFKGGKFNVYSTAGSSVTMSASTALGFTAATTTSASLSSKSFTINDGSGAKTITLAASDYAALATKTSTSNRAVNGTDLANILNAKLAAAGVKASASFGGGNMTFSTAATGTGASLTLGGTDIAKLGGTAGTYTGGASNNAKTGYGTDSGIIIGRGIIDSTAGTYDPAFGAGSYSIANVDISKLVGTAGDNDLGKIISVVDIAIAKVTDAGTKLGANKTQIDGQKNFVDTLMKANDRTIGILVDADVEEESTKLKALQTQQQLAVQALSIANSSSQNILSLFR